MASSSSRSFQIRSWIRERSSPPRLLAKSAVILDFLLQILRNDAVLVRQHQKLPGGQAQLFKQLIQGGEGGGLGIILYTGEVVPAANALTQELLGPSSVLALLLDVSADQHFFHKPSPPFQVGIGWDFAVFFIM